MLKWLEPPEIAVPERLRQTVGGSPLVADALARRGIVDPQQALAFLSPDHNHPTPPEALPGMAAAL